MLATTSTEHRSAYDRSISWLPYGNGRSCGDVCRHDGQGLIDARKAVRFVGFDPDRRYAIDSTKLQSELGWGPSVTFEEGLRATVAWDLENSTWLDIAIAYLRLSRLKHLPAHPLLPAMAR